MKKNTFSPFLLLLLFFGLSSLQAQQKSDLSAIIPEEPLQLTEENQRHFNETGFVRCATVEMEALRRQINPNIQSDQEFENWLSPLMQQRQERIAIEKANGTFRRAVVNIPIIFHVITGAQGDANDLSAARIQAQIDQLNLDFNNLSGSTEAVAESAEINFIPAQVAPDGSPLAEPGIHRVYGYAGELTTATMNNTVKPATIWDRSLYANIWSANLGGGLLGYAQFPSNSTLPGLNTNGGSALTDGVVVIPGSIGSLANPGTAAPYNAGRTLTHEIGHWIGLRHIWGDSTCGNDFCADTPESTTSNFGCPTNNQTTCDGNRDMVENYMDYTNDACMNIFTFDQVNRILTVIENADGISDLITSTTGNAGPIVAFSTSTIPSEVTEGNDCNFQDITISLAIGTAANATATATIVNSGTATENTDFEFLNNSVTFAQGSTTASNSVTLRIYEDGLVETDETIILSVDVTTTGDAEASTATYTVTIINDDTAIASAGSSVIFSDGFETYPDFQITPIGDWTMLDNDGNTTYGSNTTSWTNSGYTGTFMVFNPSQTTPSLAGTAWDAHSGNKGYYCFDATSNPNPPAVNDDYIFTPQISLNGTDSELKFWAKSVTDQYGLERFKVGISTTDTNPASFTFISAAPYVQAPIDWTEYTYDLSAYDGQDIYITFQVVSADAFAFMLDDVSVTANVTTAVQTAVNSAVSSGLNGTGVAYFTDTTTGNVMLDIDNTDGYNYGCTDVSVSRDITTAGAAAVMYSANTNPDSFVTAKTFDITTANASTSNAAAINFYFTETELADWETLTGNSRNDLFVKKEGTNEVASVSITAFGSDAKLSASFATGIEGTYVFGTQLALLSVDTFNISPELSIYPNPTTSVLNIKTTENNLPDNYAIYNMLGQVVRTAKISGVSDLQISTSEISNGMYFIKISKDNATLTLPFIKK